MDIHSPLLSFQKLFHTKLYQVDIFIDDTKLRIKLKEKSSQNLYQGEFSIVFIENLTHKAGSSKKFNIFLNMLISSLEGSSSSVIIDLESHSDLEKLRNKPLLGNSSTIYLILTYITEFDKVYYPLPLQLATQQKDSEFLISYYKHELKELNSSLISSNNENSLLREENCLLANEVQALKIQLEKEISEKLRYKTEIESLKNESNEKIKVLERTFEESKNQFEKIRGKSSQMTIENIKQNNTRVDLEKKALCAKIESLKLLNRTRKLKIKELQKEIEDNRINLKERSRSLLTSDSDNQGLKKSSCSTRCKSSMRSSENDISSRLEKIVNLLAIADKA